VRILILAVGRLKDGPERELVARYAERAAASGRALGFSGFDAVEIPESRAPRPADRKAEEAAALRARAGEAALVAFDEQGSSPTSEAFAALLAGQRDAGRRTLALVVGGPDGLDPALSAGAEARVAFGKMTLPHQIVRGLVAEQLYRAMTILSGHPYHRA
jgi:23S rRNA (pseudouridine1915-N3)-methyltransferase